jgi:hypothetical protein
MRHILRVLFLLCIAMTIGVAGSRAQEDDTTRRGPIRVWWPEALYQDGEQALLNTLFADYNDSAMNEVEYRVYPTSFEGQGPVDQLNLTYTIAPGATPDVMVVRRDQMLALVQTISANTTTDDTDPTFSIEPAPIQTLENWDTRTIVNDIAALSPNLQQLGTVNGLLYGLPYLMDVQHMVAGPDALVTAPTRIEDVITAGTPMLFPGRPRSGRVVNDTILMLYLAAGGRLIDDEGLPTLAEAALRQSLRWVDDALQNEVFSDSILNYRTPSDYLDELTGRADAFGLVDSSVFLRTEALADYRVLPVPTTDVQTLVFVDGWVWILLTADENRQEQASEFVSFMMQTDQLIDVGLATQTLPVQERALNALDTDYIESIQALLTGTIFVEGRRNQAAVALQAAFESVINGVSPNEAATVALESLSPDA